MVYFTEMRATEHYIKEHQKDVPWYKVIEILFKTKNPRKKDNKYEIDQDGYYILFELKDNVLYVINAKRTK